MMSKLKRTFKPKRSTQYEKMLVKRKIFFKELVEKEKFDAFEEIKKRYWNSLIKPQKISWCKINKVLYTPLHIPPTLSHRSINTAMTYKKSGSSTR